MLRILVWQSHLCSWLLLCSLEACAVVEPSCADLVLSSPPVPVQVMGLVVDPVAGEDGQSFDLGHGQRDESGGGGRVLVRSGVLLHISVSGGPQLAFSVSSVL